MYFGVNQLLLICGEDMDRLNCLYEELEWDHTDYLEFTIEGNHITIRNRSREGR